MGCRAVKTTRRVTGLFRNALARLRRAMLPNPRRLEPMIGRRAAPALAGRGLLPSGAPRAPRPARAPARSPAGRRARPHRRRAAPPDRRRRRRPPRRRLRDRRDRARAARRALPERRQRPVGIRLQRLRLVRVRAARRRACRARWPSSIASGRRSIRRELRAGRLVFFTHDRAPGASHVGIAIGGDEFVHAPSSTGEVRVERLSAALLVDAVRGRAARDRRADVGRG